MKQNMAQQWGFSCVPYLGNMEHMRNPNEMESLKMRVFTSIADVF